MSFVVSAREAYEAARERVILAPRHGRGRLRAKGKDRVSFLQNMLTNDVKALGPGGGLFAAVLSRHGKLITDLVLYRLEDAVLLEMEKDRVVPALEALSRYIVSEDVSLTDESAAEALFSLEGPRAAELLGELSGEPLPDVKRYHWVTRALSAVTVRVSAVPHGPGPSYDVAVPAREAERVMESVAKAGETFGLVHADSGTLETRRIEAGIPRFGIDMDESHLVLEAGLDAAISFNKGCYVGQEFVARLAHRGHVNKKLMGLKFRGDAVPEPGSPIEGGGHVTSAAHSPALSVPIALGYVHREFMEPGKAVWVETASGRLEAEVTALPFLQP